MRYNFLNARRGFSLVELSIVLVILGLLVGGILSGQALIKAAELRKITTDITKFKTAFYAFRDKYHMLPGDLTTATSFWGAADAGDGLGADCYVAVAATATCNGNGNGQISLGPESYRMWQQLVNAGLLEGRYTGVPGAAPSASYTDDIVGENIPKAPLGGSNSYSIGYSWSPMMSGGTPQNVLTLAGGKHGVGRNVEGGALSAENTWNIDTKLDDGKPTRGWVQVYTGYSACVTGTPEEYALLVTTNTACQLLAGMGL